MSRIRGPVHLAILFAALIAGALFADPTPQTAAVIPANPAGDVEQDQRRSGAPDGAGKLVGERPSAGTETRSSEAAADSPASANRTAGAERPAGVSASSDAAKGSLPSRVVPAVIAAAPSGAPSPRRVVQRPQTRTVAPSGTATPSRTRYLQIFQVATNPWHTAIATWYCGGGSRCTVGYGPWCLCAAISPDLARWTGHLVRACTSARCVTVRIVDCDCAPDHLFLGTAADNQADMDAKGRRSAVRGWDARRPHGSGHRNAKLDEARVREIRDRHATGGIGYKALAHEYGVHWMTIGRIVRRQRWSHV